MNRLSKSGIDYLTHMWSPFSGCRNWSNGVCAVGKNCWAKRMTERFHDTYPQGFEPTYYPEALLSPLSLKKPARIGVAWVGDMIGYADPLKIMGGEHYSQCCFAYSIDCIMQRTPQHTYFILTKNPERIHFWEPFPDNCYVGCSATNQHDVISRAGNWLYGLKAKHTFLSIEPLLSWDSSKFVHPLEDHIGSLSWITIGQQTPVCERTMPYSPDIEEIVQAADKAGIPVWLKNNLKSLALRPDICYRNGKLRQELFK